MLSKFASLIVAAGLFGAPVYAQSANQGHVQGMKHDTTMNQNMDMPETTGVLPTEPGQGAFAAIAEIVVLLTADPMTDWSKVNIAALRDHLVDMDMLVTDSTVSLRDVPGGLEVGIDLAASGNDAASRMVPAHAPFVQAETGWDSVVTQDGDMLIWTVTSTDAETQIRALGFYGLMATGAHHQPHHLGMARGDMVH